jgi:hypothetical protein
MWHKPTSLGKYSGRSCNHTTKITINAITSLVNGVCNKSRTRQSHSFGASGPRKMVSELELHLNMAFGPSTDFVFYDDPPMISNENFVVLTLHCCQSAMTLKLGSWARPMHTELTVL